VDAVDWVRAHGGKEMGHGGRERTRNSQLRGGRYERRMGEKIFTVRGALVPCFLGNVRTFRLFADWPSEHDVCQSAETRGRDWCREV